MFLFRGNFRKSKEDKITFFVEEYDTVDFIKPYRMRKVASNLRIHYLNITNITLTIITIIWKQQIGNIDAALRFGKV